MQCFSLRCHLNKTRALCLHVPCCSGRSCLICVCCAPPPLAPVPLQVKFEFGCFLMWLIAFSVFMLLFQVCRESN
jgi:hypothetical protein